MYPLFVAAILAGLVAVSPFAIDTYLPAIPMIARDMHAPIAWVQASVPAYLIGGAIGQFFAGPVSDQIGRKPVGLFGLALYSLSCFAISFSHSVEALLTLRVIQALGGGCTTVIVAATVRDTLDGKAAARMMALIGLIMTSAPLIAPALGSGLLLISGWRAIFITLTLYAVLMFVLLSWKVPESRVRSDSLSFGSLVKTTVENYGVVFRHRRAMGYLLGLGFSSATMFVFLSMSAFAYMEYFGASSTLFPLLFGANIVTMMITNRLGVLGLRWLQPETLFRIGMVVLLLMTLSLALYVELGHPTLPVVVTFVMLGIGMVGLVFPQGTVSYLHYFPSQAGSASALLGILRFALGAAAGAIANLLYDGTLRPMAYGMALCALAGTVGLFAVSGLTGHEEKAAH